MSIQATHRPSVQIEREIQQLRRQISLQELPELSNLEAEIHRQTARAVLDTTKRGDLAEAVADYDAAKSVWAQRGRDNRTLNDLEKELSEASAHERMTKIAASDELLHEAVSEYKSACLVAARALRNLLNQQRRAASVPGATNNLQSLRLHQFHIPHLQPVSWQGTLGQTMTEGMASFENTHERAAA